ncbi:MAG: ubiquitin-conjugating enzyme family protein [Candidatus Heimdallarchaeota archaeon]|nr:MAG: ubiquitin-conjugating enzyme family protein [Candidatus Heimdallarchaeota archaeon]
MSIRIKRIADDYNQLKKLYKQKTIKQVKAFPGGKKSVEHLAVLLEGPKGTPYEKGKFKLEIKFGPNYPYSPPFVRLHTPIWHPNFWPKPDEYKGKRNICLALVDPDLIGRPDGWSPSKNIGTIIYSILAMFNIDTAYTNPHDVFNKKAAQEYLSNRKNFMKKAHKITKKYANKKW